jgi:hypothetical protein
MYNLDTDPDSFSELDLDPHWPKNLDLDPDPHEVNADPKHWFQGHVLI